MTFSHEGPAMRACVFLCCLFLSTVAWAASPPPLDASPRQVVQEGWINVLEPEEWRGEGTRGLVIQQRRSVRVSGLAFHPTGVTRILINGEPAALDFRQNGQVSFLGYVVVGDDTREVEIVAYSGGEPLVRTYGLVPRPADKTYPDPEEAWNEVAGGFVGQRFAVVVGISEYQDSTIPALRYAHEDAQAFYDFLISPRSGLGGFEPENVTLLLDDEATYRSLRTALFTFLQQATERDVVILYYAGHGAADPYRPTDYYLLPFDTEAANLPGTAMPMPDVSAAVGRLRARDVIVVTDACHSAAVGGQAGVRVGSLNDINRAFLERLEMSRGGHVTITASEVSQLSQEDVRWGGGHGVFTHYLLEALDGAADADRDRIVTLGEMFEYTRDRVQRETRNAQVPTVSQTPWDRAWPMSMVPAPESPSAEEPEFAEQVARPDSLMQEQVEAAARIEQPEEEETSPRVSPDARTGWWFSLGGGLGASDFEQKQISIDGRAQTFSLSLGWFVRRDLVLFAYLGSDWASGNDGEVLSTGDVVENSDATLGSVGAGLRYYFGPRNFFFSAAILARQIGMEQDELEGIWSDAEYNPWEKAWGGGAELIVGKEFQMGRSFATSVGLRAHTGNGSGEGNEFTAWRSNGVNLVLALVYSPRGLGWLAGSGAGR